METLILVLATLIILIALNRGDAAARVHRRPDAHQLMIPAASKSPSQASLQEEESLRRGALLPLRRQP
jgi:hypothetical protein